MVGERSAGDSGFTRAVKPESGAQVLRFPHGSGALPKGYTRRSSGKIRTYVLVGSDRSQVVRSFSTLVEAQAWREAAQEAVKRGEPIPEGVSSSADIARRYTKFETVLDEWHADYKREKQGKFTPRTIELHELHMNSFLKPSFGSRRANEISRDDVRDFRDGLAEQGYSETWASRILWLLWSSLEYAKAAGVIEQNPAYKISAATPAKPLRRRGRQRVVTYTETLAMSRLINDHFRLGLWIQRLCGLRIAELYGLQLRDIDRATQVLRVQRQGGKNFTLWDDDGQPITASVVERTKTRSGERIVGIPEALMDLIDVYIARYHADSGPTEPLIRSPRGGTGSNPYQQSLTRAAKRLSVTDSVGNNITSHVLRKSYLTDLEGLGVPQLVRSIVAGHKVGAYDGGSSITAGTYTLATGKVAEIRSAASKLNDALRAEIGDRPLDVAAEVDSPTGEWITGTRAAEELGVSNGSLLDLVRQGCLVARTHKNPNQTTAVRYISRDSLDAWIAALADRVYLVEVGEKFRMNVEKLTQAAREVGVEVHTQGGRSWVASADYEVLEGAIGFTSNFLATHYSSHQVKDLLDVPDKTLYALERTRWLKAELPEMSLLEQNRRKWFTRDSVANALAHKDAWWTGTRKRPVLGPEHPTNKMLSRAEAAPLIGISQHVVSQLIAEGVLEAVKDRGQWWIRQGSALAYRDGNRRSMRREAREQKARSTASLRSTVSDVPEMIAQWHPTRNEGVNPASLSAGSQKKAWWADERGHEWEAPVRERRAGRAQCPVCRYKETETVSDVPEMIAQWHPTRNEDTNPHYTPIGSGRKVWWLGECGHEWEAQVKMRSPRRSAGMSGCPVCTNRAVSQGENDLATISPQAAQLWHPTKNGSVSPRTITATSTQKVWWQCDSGHEWVRAPRSFTQNPRCPRC